MQQDLRNPQVPRRKCPWDADPWICRGISQIFDAQEIGADRIKNRSI